MTAAGHRLRDAALYALTCMREFPHGERLALEVIDAGYCLDAPEHLPDGSHFNPAAHVRGARPTALAGTFARSCLT